MCAVVSGFLAIVASRKASARNRIVMSDAYVKIEDGYAIDDDMRGSMYDPFGQLKPIHQKLLRLCTSLADEDTGLTIKVRKIGMRQVKPCIVGFRFIDWAIREGHAKTRPEAIVLGNELIAKRYLLRSDGKTSSTHKSKRGRELAEFLDDSVFYFFAVQERPKLFIPLDDEVRDRLQYGFRPEKLGTPGLVLFPVGVFGVPLGVMSFSLVWLNIGSVFAIPFFEIVGFIFAGLATLAFVACLVAYTLKSVRHPAAVKDEFGHPFKVNLFGMISITWLLGAVVSAFINTVMCQVFFYTGTILQLFATLFLASRWVKMAKNLTVKDINPSYFIPIAGIAVIPIASVPAQIREFGYLMLGAAVIYWILMFSLLFARLFFLGAMYKSSLPLLFIAVAPPSLISIAYMTLTPVLDIGGRFFYGIALFNLCMFSIIRLSTPSVSFALTHWAYVFPLSAFAVASLKYAQVLRDASATAPGLTLLLVTISVVAATVFFVWCSVMTVIQGFRRKLIGREAKMLSEETAQKVYQGKITAPGGSMRSTQTGGSSRSTIGRSTGNF